MSSPVEVVVGKRKDDDATVEGDYRGERTGGRERKEKNDKVNRFLMCNKWIIIL